MRTVYYCSLHKELSSKCPVYYQDYQKLEEGWKAQGPNIHNNNKDGVISSNVHKCMQFGKPVFV